MRLPLCESEDGKLSTVRYRGCASGLEATPSWRLQGYRWVPGIPVVGDLSVTAGDVDGDGRADLLLSGFGREENAPLGGRTLLFLGPAAGLPPSPVLELSGIPPIHAADAEGAPEWRPWPGETLRLALGRPAGVRGQTITIDQSSLRLTPGIRSTDVQLSLSARSSRGALHTITLPPGYLFDHLLEVGFRSEFPAPFCIQSLDMYIQGLLGCERLYGDEVFGRR